MWVIETIKYSWLVCIVISITHVVFVVLLLSHVWLFAAPWTAARQVSLSFTISQSLLKLMSVESVMPSNSLIVCHPLLLPSIFPSIGVFSNESALCFRWPKYWSFSFSINPSNEYSGLISLGLTGLISLQSKRLSKNFLQHHCSKASMDCYIKIAESVVSKVPPGKPYTYKSTDLRS